MSLTSGVTDTFSCSNRAATHSDAQLRSSGRSIPASGWNAKELLSQLPSDNNKSAEHTYEIQSLLHTTYAVVLLKTKYKIKTQPKDHTNDSKTTYTDQHIRRHYIN